jgi:hypothetical protein
MISVMNVRAWNRLEMGYSVAWLVLFGASSAAADEVTLSEAVPAQPVQHLPRITGIHLDHQTGWSLGLEGYAGLTTLSTAEGTKGHAIAGGVSRFRLRFFEIGAGIESSDYYEERWRTLGGFIGAYLPFTNWVDIDANVGLAIRNYTSSDTRYGPTGAQLRVPALTLRLGLSDRPLGRLISPRLGAALLFGFDLKQRDVAWTYEVPSMEPITGVSKFGGITAGIVMSFGFDLAFRNDR